MSDNNGGGVVTPVPVPIPVSASAPVVKRGRASLSTSPLARPNSLIHQLASRIQDYIYLPVPDPLYVVLGTVAANMMKGSPVWVVLIGPPSSGRTILLETLANLPRIHIVGAVKSPSALLSGTGNKEKSKSATGGLLRQIGARGMMVMKDFTSMLSMAREPLAEAIGALRETFDGRYSRPLGTDGGKVLEWKGRIGFLAACTPAIDRHSALIGDLGERWIYYRYDITDGYGETIKSLGVRDPELMMEELRALVTTFIEALELTWEDGGTERRELTRGEKDRLYAMGSLICAARSAVPRDPWNHNEVSDVAAKEAPPRIAGELGQLYLGLEKIGIEEAERWRLVGKIALDSVRQIRILIIQLLRVSKIPVHPKVLVGAFQCGRKTVDTMLEDLTIHGMVRKTSTIKGRNGKDLEGDGGVDVGGYVLTDWASKLMDAAFGKVTL